MNIYAVCIFKKEKLIGLQMCFIFIEILPINNMLNETD